MRVENVLQGTAEWMQVKAGSLTGSRFAEVMRTRRDGKQSECRRKLKLELVAERMTGMMTTNYVSQSMTWGIEQEPIARTEYELKTGNDVRLVGYVHHPTLEWAGCSPDGLVNPDGTIEVKCPETTTHVDYLIAKKVPPVYEPQCNWVLACTERDWLDFVSFDPRMPNKHKLLVVRLYRDEKRIAEMNEAARLFLIEVDDLYHQLLDGEEYLLNRLTASVAQAQA